jgi:hypothetical protein
MGDRSALEAYTTSLTNPFSIPIAFRLLDAKEYGLSSPVIVGADTYLAAKVERVPNFEIAYGYSFEKVCLYALSRGIGTVMLAASLSRAAFEKAMEVEDGEVMPVASPLGYPAEEKSIREGLMRKGLKADERKPFDKLFFEGGFHQPLPQTNPYAQALEMARWAPSAGNGQPWRGVVDGESVHFYEARSLKDSPLGDIQKVDVGIALAHFDMTLEEAGVKGSYCFSDPGIPTAENIHYIVTYRRA